MQLIILWEFHIKYLILIISQFLQLHIVEGYSLQILWNNLEWKHIKKRLNDLVLCDKCPIFVIPGKDTQTQTCHG